MNNTLSEIRIKGWKALVKELGCAGATKFIIQFENGLGDYTKDRQKLLNGISLENIFEEIKEKKRTRHSAKSDKRKS
jgi:hypothetical protein